MIFNTPSGTSFEIADEWWNFADMTVFSTNGGGYFPYAPTHEGIQIIPLASVEPPRRADGVPAFKKYKLIPIFLAFQSPECALPPIAVVATPDGPYRYRVANGFHRYYAAAAVGYEHLPVLVHPAPID